MSSAKNTNNSAVDNAVAERRIRPIYDWLDCGNNKKALQEAEKLLKKQPNFQCAKVLKGLALLRLGKEKECEEIISAVHKEVPYAEATLQTMTICYRELHKPELICDLYAAASKKDPTSEEILTHLFMSYVRVSDYKKQQITAMSLYKLIPKNPYYFWAVMSIVMQAQTSNPDLKSSVVLPLAERMVDKLVKQNKIEAEQEVQLYIMILEMQGKLEETLNVIEGPLGEKLQSCISIPAKRVSLLMKLKRWSEANVHLKKLLKDEIDSWTYYMDYFESCFNLIDHPDDDKSDKSFFNDADRTIEDCAGFLSNIQEENQRLSRRLRGPYLAHLEFYSRLTKRGDKTDVHLGDLVELFILYFHEFGTKQCCLSDLRPYLDLLSKNQAQDFLNQISRIVQLDNDVFSSRQQMLRHLSELQLNRCLGLHDALDVGNSIQLVQHYMKCYNNGQEYNKDRLSTDFCDNDPYVLIIGQILYDVWVKTDDSAYLSDAILHLEQALANSVSNYQLKLLLLKLYNLIGCTKTGHTIYELLDIKHMQLDTLGYVHLWPLLSSGQYTMAYQIINSTLKFFMACWRESADHLTFSYKYGSFLKISEFVKFRDRLNNSLHYAMVRTEKTLLDLFHCTSYQHAAQVVDQASKDSYFNFNFDILEDNRDFTVFWTANPVKRKFTSECITVSYKTEIDLLRIRMLILQTIINFVNLSEKVNQPKMDNLENPNFNSENDLIELKKTAIELLDIYDRLKKCPHPKLPNNIIEAPPESRIHDYMESDFIPIVIGAFKLINGIAIKRKNFSDEEIMNVNGCHNTSETSCYGDQNGQDSPIGDNAYWRTCSDSDYRTASEVISALLSKTIDNFVDKVHQTPPGLEGFSNVHRTIRDMAIVVEMASFVTVSCGVAHALVKDLKTPLLVKKNRKKKKEDPADSTKSSETLAVRKELLCSVESFVGSSQKSVERLMETTKSFEKAWNLDDIISKLSNFQISKDECHKLNQSISDSYQESIRELHSVLRRKLRCTNELKF